MQCAKCKREMVPLFLTQACDYCDYGVPKEKLHRGFIVYRGPDSMDDDSMDGSSCVEYVFRTRLDAELWRTAGAREGCTIQEVYSLAPFQWHVSRGSLREVVLADHMFDVFKDWRYESLPHRCFLSSKQQEHSASASDYDDLPF